MSEVNSLLRRNILPGKEFAGLIPESNCKKVDAGTGFTDHSIDVMVEVIEEFSWQMEKVAEKLEASTLVDTVDNVFDFCHDHFQYKADKADQFLRSPACSWFDRYNGIDCKSYTILASSILTELGINHYIRKTKQPGDAPENYTHVYVIVPYDQAGFDLQKGYCIIDGTVYNNEEPPFLATNDRFMEGLRHYVLNGPGLSGPDDEPVNQGGTSGDGTFWGNVGNQASTAATDYVSSSGFSFKSIVNAFKTPMDCWGGTGFKPDMATIEINSLDVFMRNIIIAINEALLANNMPVFSEKCAEYFGMSALFANTVDAKVRSQSWNSCSRTNFRYVEQAAEFFYKVGGQALKKWLETSFNQAPNGATRSYNSSIITSRNIWDYVGYVNPLETVTTPYILYSKKANTPIASFQLNEYAYTFLENVDGFNATTFLGFLSPVYNAVTNPGSIFTGNNPTNNPNNPAGNNGSTTLPIKDIDKPDTMGMNIFVGLLLAGALVYGTMSFAPNKKSPKQ